MKSNREHLKSIKNLSGILEYLTIKFANATLESINIFIQLIKSKAR